MCSLPLCFTILMPFFLSSFFCLYPYMPHQFVLTHNTSHLLRRNPKLAGRSSTRRASSYHTSTYSSRMLPDIGSLNLNLPGTFQVKTASNTPAGSPSASPTRLSSPMSDLLTSPTMLSSVPDRSDSLSPGPHESLNSPRSLAASPELGVSSRSRFSGFSSSLLTGFNSSDRPSRSAYSQRRSGTGFEIFCVSSAFVSGVYTSMRLTIGLLMACARYDYSLNHLNQSIRVLVCDM
jgi:hypothetical protein